MSTDVSDIISPCNTADMIQSRLRPPDFVLDGIHFGRGDSYLMNYANEKHVYKTLETKCWEVNGDSLTKVEPQRAGHFYATSNYLVYAKYEAKVYDLNTNEELSKLATTYDLCFYWRGAKGPQTAPFPDELEAINPPVQRIVQWSELPILVRLFQGTLMIHIDKTLREARLYILRGTIEQEAHFIEIPAEKCNLRSRTSFLLVVPKSGTIFVWHGSKSDERNPVLIKNVVSKLLETRLSIFGVNSNNIKVVEIHEGSESDEFLSSLVREKNDYFSLKQEPQLYNYTARLFYFNSIIGTFLATEVEDTLASENDNPFPFLQNHLYSAKQPGDTYTQLQLSFFQFINMSKLSQHVCIVLIPH